MLTTQLLENNITYQVSLNSGENIIDNQNKILVTGATGYIGSNLIKKLLTSGYNVRAMVRTPRNLDIYDWVNDIEVVQADVLKPDSIAKSMQGISVAYYLIHSMAAGQGFEERDITAAKNFAEAARSSGVNRIIYLGGLGEKETGLSSHLESRQKVGQILASTGIPVTEFRAAVIVGTGSLSFEMIRYLTDRVPLMVCPKWVFTKIQPISIEDVLSYLALAIDTDKSAGRIIEIGGRDVLTYGDLMLIYARLRGLRRFMLRVPVLTPKLSSYWVHLVTPIPSSMAIPLIEGLKSEVVVTNNDALEIFPDIFPQTYEQSVRNAIDSLHPDSLSPFKQIEHHPGHLGLPHFCIHKEGMIIETKNVETEVPRENIIRVIESIGGDNRWWGLEFIWFLRGLLDRLFGGEGYARYRTRPGRPEAGDRIDFLDVERVIDSKELFMKVRFKLPGKGWMRFRVEPKDSDKNILSLTVFFAPKGLTGVLYWYSLLPFHRVIFNIMLRKIISQSKNQINE